MRYILASIISVTLCVQLVQGQVEKLKIYLDCNQVWLCDGDYLRQEITNVDFVRDRFLSDVHIISNIQFTGNGGEANTLRIVGQKSNEGKVDTFTYFNDVTASEDTKRKKMLKYIQIGILPYLMKKSGNLDQITISYVKDEDVANEKKHDPYNLWQFTLAASGFFNGDRNYSSATNNFNVSASRESAKEKFYFELNNNINRNRISFYKEGEEEPEIIRVRKDEQSIFTRYIRKLDEHWGIGLQGNYRRSIFDNIDARVTVLPQVEYSIFPYKKFNDQRLVINYSLGPRYFNYKDTTIYLKTKELLLWQNIGVINSFTKQWGSLNLGAFWSNYYHDWSKNNFSLEGSISWNVFKGLKFTIGGSYNLIHDQLSLPKLNATRDDLLTQRRLIATSYEYFGGIGFSYTFGSIYNSQVHPTFRGLSYGFNF